MAQKKPLPWIARGADSGHGWTLYTDTISAVRVIVLSTTAVTENRLNER